MKKNRKTINVATVFSGIGAIEQALVKSNISHNIVFACDNGERYIKETYEELLDEFKLCKDEYNNDINSFIKYKYENTKKINYVKQSYCANYDIEEKNWYDDVRFIDGKKYQGSIDLFVGGSPCQSFSVIGKRAGLNDARGTLFYEFARLVDEIQPKVFIYENVVGMMSHDKGNTWVHILEIFESLNYNISYKIVNAVNHGIPQNRKRIFVVGVKKEDQKFEFPESKPLTTISSDYLEEDVNNQYYLGKKGFEFVTNPKYKNRAKVNQNIIMTQKANQQFNWCGDFIFENNEILKDDVKSDDRIYLGSYFEEVGSVRKLTPRECLRLMGYDDSFKIVVPDVQIYRQAGNSIVVNIFESFLPTIMYVIGDGE